MVNVADLFRGTGVTTIFKSGKPDVVYTELESREKDIINKVFNYGIERIKDSTPKIAANIEKQKEAAIRAAGIFKEMIPEKKSYAFPSEAGSLGVAWLFPGAIKYAATPSATLPCYTSYKTNLWEIDVTAGTPAYIFGDGTNFYKASPTTGKHAMLLIFENGIVEEGSTPRTEVFRLYAEGEAKYGVYTATPLVEEPTEDGKLIYQYKTPLGATLVYYDKGIMWGFMPKYDGTSKIELLGLIFYEHDLFPDLASTWIT